MDIPFDENKENLFYASEQFDDAWNKLKVILTDPNTNELYDWFEGRPNSEANTREVNDKLVFGGYVGPQKSIEGYTHELGHLMVTPNEYVGTRGWGLGTYSYGMSEYSIDKMPMNTYAQIKLEAKVWAWTYLIECMAGLRVFGEAEGRHREAELLFGDKNSRDALYVHNEINKNIQKIMQGNPYDEIRQRFSDVRRILDYNKAQWDIINTIDFYNLETIEIAKREHDNTAYIIKLEKDEKSNYFVVSMSKEINGERILYEAPYGGFNEEKAYKIFHHNAKINELEIEPKNILKM